MPQGDVWHTTRTGAVCSQHSRLCVDVLHWRNDMFGNVVCCTTRTTATMVYPPPHPHTQALAVLPIFTMPFYSASLVFMLIYLWSRYYPTADVKIWGLVNVKVQVKGWLQGVSPTFSSTLLASHRRCMSHLHSWWSKWPCLQGICLAGCLKIWQASLQGTCTTAWECGCAVLWVSVTRHPAGTQVLFSQRD